MLKILNNKRVKNIAKELGKRYGVSQDLFDGFEVLSDGNDVWICSRECLEQDLEGLKAESMGLQVLRNKLPTVNGTQLLFESADMTELEMEEAFEFIKGKPIRNPGKIMSYRSHPLDLAGKTGDGTVRKNSI